MTPVPTVNRALSALLAELADGAGSDEAWILNRGDGGLLSSLDRLPAAAASAPGPTGACVAAHASHLAYGFELLNRWARGENPFPTADYSADWRLTAVSESEWEALRRRLREEIAAWKKTVSAPQAFDEREIKILASSVCHLAYHLGAIRQIAPAAGGPKERG